MSNPFDESDDDDLTTQQNEGLVINKSFADKFESQERKKDLSRAKELLDDDDESDSESEDDEGELISTSLDIEIVKVINRIRKKDPKIYDKTTTWFQRTEDGDQSDEDDDVAARKGEKKKRFKDILREQLLKHGADIEQDDRGEYTSKSSVGRSSGVLGYDEEQQKLRRDFLKSVGDDDEEDDIMKVRGKDPAERAQEELDLNTAMVEMRELGADAAEHGSADADAFLLDYISKQSWKSTQKYVTRTEEDEESEDDYEQDEDELDKVDLFEHKYNFRFEELQGGDSADGTSRSNVIGMGLQSLQVTGHARSVEGSLRRVDEKRKTQRESRKVNKDKEKRVKEAELKRLKSLKNQEMQEKLKQIMEVSGLGEGGLGFDQADLDEDWDPEKYEAMMQAQFGDDYYGEEDNSTFAARENEDGEYEGGEDEDMGGGGLGEGYEGEEGEGGEAEDEEYDDGSAGYSGGKEGKPSKAKIVNGMLDELYKLDYEDIIAGMPCRFKYRQVEKEDFGLTAEEIFLADDSELNKFVSLKKISAYSDAYGGGDQAHKVAKKRKRLRVAIKERLQKEAEDAEAAGLEIKGLKKKVKSEDTEEKEEEGEEVEVADIGDKDASSKKRRRRKLKEIISDHSSASVEETVSEAPVVEMKVKKEEKEVNESKGVKGVKVSKKSSNKGGKDDRSEVSRKKRKSSAMAAAPVASKSSVNSKPKSSSENQQRRAGLYK